MGASPGCRCICPSGECTACPVGVEERAHSPRSLEMLSRLSSGAASDTAKRFDSAARGRKAHPGKPDPPPDGLPRSGYTGLRRPPCPTPSGSIRGGCLLTQGALRPRAAESNAFGVKTRALLTCLFRALPLYKVLPLERQLEPQAAA